jgi:hypothetical protein
LYFYGFFVAVGKKQVPHRVFDSIRNDKLFLRSEDGMAKKRKGLYGFKTFSARGSWVEMLFMAAASFHGFQVLTPWCEASAYDVAIEVAGRILRVQVKSTTFKTAMGYRCEFHCSRRGRQSRYKLGEMDICAAYVVPEKIWYIFPAHRVTGRKGTPNITVCQREGARSAPKYECYREAWELLGMDRGELAGM